MSVLEQIQKMREQGISDEDITNKLHEQGISPKIINDSFNRAQIKHAISGEDNMQASIMKEGSEDYASEKSLQNSKPQRKKTKEISENDFDAPEPEEDFNQERYSSQPQEILQEREFYPQENYNEYYTGETDNTENLIDIAEQIFSEKIKKINLKVENIEEFENLAQIKITNIEERVRRMEKIIDQLQITILEKIGSYGNNLENINKEMRMMQDSFGKMINPLADNIERKILRKK